MTPEALQDGLADNAEATEITEEQAMSAAYDRLTSEGIEEEETDAPADQPEDEASDDDGPEEEPQDGEEEGEEGDSDQPPPQAKAPSHLPEAVKQNWDKIPEAARDALSRSYQEMAHRVNNAARAEKGLAPIKEVLTEAARAMPHMLEMKPAEIAQDMLQLARISQQFNERPVETILELVQRHGLESAVAAAFQGRSVEPGVREAQLMNEVRGLKRELARLGDPQYLQEQVSTVNEHNAAVAEVERFMGQAEHWQAVESILPQYIAAARAAKPGASNADTLQRAYKMACSEMGLAVKDAKAGATEEVAQKRPDAAKADAARKAKSVNVSGTRSGKTRQLTEMEALSAAYDRIVRK